MAYNVYSEFDIKKHKETYVNYLEVMIDRDGTVHYAVPSHQEWAISEVCRQKGITRKELEDMTPPEYYWDWLSWLLGQCGCLAVWDGFYYGEPNKKQVSKLKALKLSGLYHGKICQQMR